MPYSSEQKLFCSHSQSHLFTGAHPKILKKGEDKGRRRRAGGGGGAPPPPPPPRTTKCDILYTLKVHQIKIVRNMLNSRSKSHIM